ncbi:carbamoyltransferase C-terminal domain-containing protein [candidate division CSSED10-310 bacterium]|uniref:Carbamoyltransferase C-terminal domain-containing protein n=1 Tax=candidate division CSSED10-310 bacterium TaxID=2855610 RepID=A0ABV6YSU1_UNCC1
MPILQRRGSDLGVVLGVSLSHYGSACVFVDGEIKSAVLEERLSRKKYEAGFPARSISKVLESSGISPRDIDTVAIGTMCEMFDSNLARDREYRVATSLVSFFSNFIPISILETEWMTWLYQKIFHSYNRWNILHHYFDTFKELGISRRQIKFYDHHSCHAATAYYASPWRDNVLIFTSDGNGDGYCGLVALGQGDHWTPQVKISSIHSLGGLYSRSTRLIGLVPWHDEYKVMGLAPWGERKKQADLVYKKFKEFWGASGLTYRNLCGYACNSLLAFMRRSLHNPRFDYVAYAVQRVLEEILAEWIKNNMAFFKLKKIALSGGIFYNIKANKYIVEQTEPEDVFIFPTAGDESISIGAAYLAYKELQQARNLPLDIKPIKDVYWGEEIADQIEPALQNIDRERYVVEYVNDIEERIASLLAANHIVAVCNSRMEYCPRALGNRSILANPSDLRNIERLNDTIKRRDFWMPFALTVLKECEQMYLVNPHHLPSHYMIMGFDTRPEKRNDIIAGIHQADKTVRPQILEQDFNPRFHSIISKFHKKTGIGAVLNTSLNLHGEPMVNLPSEALTLMAKSELQYLALGNYLVTKKSPSP